MVNHSPKCQWTQFSILPFSQMIFDHMAHTPASNSIIDRLAVAPQ